METIRVNTNVGLGRNHLKCEMSHTKAYASQTFADRHAERMRRLDLKLSGGLWTFDERCRLVRA